LGSGARTSTSYDDAFDRILSQTDANGQTTRYTYSPDLRQTSITGPDGAVITQQNNASDKQSKSLIRIRTARPTNTITKATCSKPMPRLQKDRIPTGGSTTASRLIESYDANGNKTTYTYDAANQLLSQSLIMEDGRQITTSYRYGIVVAMVRH
jgi:YD repeat-containing protein